MKKLKSVYSTVLLFLLTSVAAMAQCALQINNTTSGSAGILATSLTISHTATGSNRLLIVRASTSNGDPATVKYNAISLTKLATGNNGSQYVSLWYLINPPAGTFNVVLTGAVSFTPIAGVTSFSGAHQTTPFGTVVSGIFNGANPSLNVSSATGEIVVDVTKSKFALTVGAGQTQQYNIANFVWRGSGSSEPGAGSVTMSWTGFFPSGVQLAVPVKPVPPLVANAGTDQEVCAGVNVSIGDGPTASGGTPAYAYAWSPSSGLNSTTVSNPVASPSSTTNYTVTVTDAVGCTATDVVTVTVNPLPVVSAGPDKVICYGHGTTIGGSPTVSSGTPPFTYNWSPASELSSTTIANPTASPTTSTTYTINVTDSKGCTGSSIVSVTVNPSPNVGIAGNTSIFESESTELSVLTSAGTPVYSWSTGATTISITVTPQTNTTYSVTVTDENNCTGSASVVVTVAAGYYASLSKKLDGGYYSAVSGKINFSYNEEYNDPDGQLSYRILDKINIPVASVPVLNVVHGYNRLTLNVACINGGLVAGNYILEVTSSKGEKSFLRFKYENAVSCQ